MLFSITSATLLSRFSSKYCLGNPIFNPLIEKYIGSLPSLDRKAAFVDHGFSISQSKDYFEYIEEDSKKATVIRIYNKEFDYKYKEMIKSNKYK